MSELTASDILALNKDRDDNFLGGNGAGFIVLILFFLTMGGGFGGWGNNGSLTRADLHEAIASESTQNMIGTGFANVNQNLCCGFAGVNQNINNVAATNALAQNCGFNSVNENINSLGARMQDCCCTIRQTITEDGEKTRNMIQQNIIQDLRDKLQDEKNERFSTGIITAQTIQTNNIENFIHSLTQGCGC